VVDFLTLTIFNFYRITDSTDEASQKLEL